MPDHLGCPECCCILEICCPPPGGEPLTATAGPDKRTKAMAAFIVRRLPAFDVPITRDVAMAVATVLGAQFDFAPRGSLGPLVQHITAMARREQPDGG